MEFREFVDQCKCFMCGSSLEHERDLEIPNFTGVQLLSCSCANSFKFAYDKSNSDDSFMIHLPMNDDYIRFEVDTGREQFRVVFVALEPRLLDNNKYYTTDHVPSFITLPKDELLIKLNELLVFI